VQNHVYDAVVIGSGPNGLAAGIYLAQRNLSVLIVEAAEKIGGGMRSEEVTLPGFVHDICSAIHPLTIVSPFFRTLPLADYGLEFVQPRASVAHALDDGTAVLLKTSVEETAEGLGADSEKYKSLVTRLARNFDALVPDLLAPLRFPRHNPFLMAGFGLRAMTSARKLVDHYFQGERARALFAGNAAHSMIPLEDTPSAAYGLVLLLTGHAVGWGFPRGGAQKIAEALSAYFLSLGGVIETGWEVKNVDELPASRTVFFNVTPRQILKIAGHRLPDSYRRSLEKFRYGGGVYKMDFALSEPIPWKAKECFEAGTVHCGGAFEEVAASERAQFDGIISDKPFVLVTQNSLFDATRAPAGKQIGWAYCHIPHNSPVDMSETIENQIERFAPGFRDCILAKAVKTAPEMERWNANYVGGDINGGAGVLSQLFTRPVAKFDPYRMPTEGYYICSSSTPPGGGVHGMCGYHAAKSAFEREFS
jgi:phytoene dehydrogenase-like protein